MPTKLDESIARLAVVIGKRDRKAMSQAAADVAGGVSAKDLAKLPDRWYPALSSKKANAPDLSDSWERLWFEAIAEILYQKAQDGVPGLVVLAERNDSTYHEYAIVRLLRLAADGVESDAVLDRVRRRLATLQHVWTRETVREIVYWTQVDPRPLKLLRPMSDIVVPNTDGGTVGQLIDEMQEELAFNLARKKK